MGFTAVTVAVEDEPFIRVTNTSKGLFTVAYWKLTGFGFATNTADPLP
jgi:hypothetical protein